MERDFAGKRADQGRDLVANVNGHLPPAFFPCADATLLPSLSISVHAVVYASGHGTQRVADQVGSPVEDREFATILEQVVHRSKCDMAASGIPAPQTGDTGAPSSQAPKPL